MPHHPCSARPDAATSRGTTLCGVSQVAQSGIQSALYGALMQPPPSGSMPDLLQSALLATRLCTISPLSDPQAVELGPRKPLMLNKLRPCSSTSSCWPSSCTLGTSPHPPGPAVRAQEPRARCPHGVRPADESGADADRRGEPPEPRQASVPMAQASDPKARKAGL